MTPLSSKWALRQICLSRALAALGQGGSILKKKWLVICDVGHASCPNQLSLVCPTVLGGERVPGAEVLHSGEGLRDVQEPHEHHHRAAGGGGT